MAGQSLVVLSSLLLVVVKSPVGQRVRRLLVRRVLDRRRVAVRAGYVRERRVWVIFLRRAASSSLGRVDGAAGVHVDG